MQTSEDRFSALFHFEGSGKFEDESLDPRRNAFEVFRCKLLNDRFPRSFSLKEAESLRMNKALIRVEMHSKVFRCKLLNDRFPHSFILKEAESLRMQALKRHRLSSTGRLGECRRKSLHVTLVRFDLMKTTRVKRNRPIVCVMPSSDKSSRFCFQA